MYVYIYVCMLVIICNGKIKKLCFLGTRRNGKS